jgi:phosphoribosylamine---glycine ligase
MCRMKVLLIGSGGREHTLAWRLAQSPQLDQLLIAPGNPGTARLGRNIAIPVTDLDALADLAQREAVDLVVVGPEDPLVHGLVDRCLARGIPAFGPTAAAARIEGSKSFAKTLMQEAGVPTAASHTFATPADAATFVRKTGQPWVVKADGLAQGKGVVVPRDVAATLAAIERLGTTAAGTRLVLEERLHGCEISVLALCDGKTLLPLPPARDHKRLLDGDNGPNTGGMGAVAPIEDVDVAQIVAQCMQPVVDRLAARGTPFCGSLYAGLILTECGPLVLEFNARLGDPEAQVVLPLVEGDLPAALMACAEGRLDPGMLRRRSGYAACVVLAAAGYPDAPRRGDPIHGTAAVETADLLLFHAGTAQRDDTLVTAGGRVLGVTGLGPDMRVALDRAYDAIRTINFADKQYRTDIGA